MVSGWSKHEGNPSRKARALSCGSNQLHGAPRNTENMLFKRNVCILCVLCRRLGGFKNHVFHWTRHEWKNMTRIQSNIMHHVLTFLIDSVSFLRANQKIKTVKQFRCEQCCCHGPAASSVISLNIEQWRVLIADLYVHHVLCIFLQKKKQRPNHESPPRAFRGIPAGRNCSVKFMCNCLTRVFLS